jgi:hypothetical protein
MKKADRSNFLPWTLDIQKDTAHDQEGKSRIGSCPSKLPVKNTTRNIKIQL